MPALVFLVAAFAETNRLPFDLPEAESELVGGYHTEYSSMKFALFFLGEYVGLMTMSALMVTLFLGGWTLPGVAIPEDPSGWFVLGSVCIFLVKFALMVCFYIVLRLDFSDTLVALRTMCPKVFFSPLPTARR